MYPRMKGIINTHKDLFLMGKVACVIILTKFFNKTLNKYKCNDKYDINNVF